MSLVWTVILELIYVVNILIFSDHHVDSFKGVIISMERAPVYAVSVCIMVPRIIFSIQVATVTGGIPPCTLELYCTARAVTVVVHVVSRELRPLFST